MIVDKNNHEAISTPRNPAFANPPMTYLPPNLVGSAILQGDSKRATSSPVISLGLAAWGAVVLEGVVVVAAAAIAKLIYIDLILASQQTIWPYLSLGIVGELSILLTFHLMRLYDPNVFLRDRIDIPQIGTAILAAFALVLFQLFALHVSGEYSRGWLALWFILTFAGIVAGRACSRSYLRKWLYQGRINRRIALFGSKTMVDGLAQSLSQMEAESVVVARFIVDPQIAMSEHWQSELRSLFDIGQSSQCDQIVIAVPMTESALINNAVRSLAALPIDVLLVTDIPAAVATLGYTEFAGLPAFKLHKAPLTENQWVLKAAFDTVTAAVMLIVFFPLLLAIAAAIKYDSRGPIFFKQRRNGYNHRIFRVYKFRTMTVLEDGDQVRQATADDDRVTRVGRFLRRTSLDELPQLLNVLKGDMSLVGPRPHALAHNEYYSKLWAEYALRHRVKPGITGLAQAGGYRGETSDPEEMRKRAELDVEYARNWSLWGDVKIMLRTVAVLYGQKAY